MIGGRSGVLAPLLAAASLGGCSFLLDFDALDEDRGQADAAAGSGGSGGSAGSNACGACDDGNPCTEDVCDGATCRHYSRGLISRGQPWRREADAVPRVVLTANDKGFYGTALVADSGGVDVQVFAFDTTADQPVHSVSLRDVPELAGKVYLGAAGIFARNTTPYDVTLGMPVRDAGGPAAAPGEVWRVSFKDDLTPGVQAPRQIGVANFALDGTGQRHPMVWGVSSKVHIAWIGADNLVHVDDGGLGLNKTLAAGQGLITAIAPFYPEPPAPALFVFSDQPYAAFVDGSSQAFARCSSAPGTIFNADTGSTATIPGVNVLTWSLAHADGSGELDYAESETRFANCGAGACGIDDRCGDEPQPSVLSTSIEMISRQGEANVVYEVAATVLVEGAEASSEVVLKLQALRVDLGQDGGVVTLLTPPGGLEVTRAPATGAIPTLPELAVSGASQVGVAWAEIVDGAKNAAVFSRYELCFATDDDRLHPRPPGP